MTLRRSLLLAFALLAALPSAVHAEATVSKTGSEVLIKSTADEPNVVDIHVGGGAVSVSYISGAGLVAGGGGCALGAGGIVCPAAGVSVIRAELGPGDDGVTSAGEPVRRELLGEGGDDDLAGGDGDDLLVGGPGVDDLDGGAGDDQLDSADGIKDDLSDCGPGDDDMDDDTADDFSPSCEVIAPEYSAPIFIGGGPVAAFNPVHIRWNGTMWLHGTIGHASQTERVRWYRCDAGGQPCTVVQEEEHLVSRILTLDDVGSRMYAEMSIANRAGAFTAKTDLTEPVAPGSLPTPPVPPAAPPSNSAPAKSIDPPAPNPVKPPSLGTVLKAELKTGTATLARTSLRKLASRKSLDVSFTAPVAGTYTLTLTVPAKAARKLGVRGSRPVVLATGALKTTGALRKVKAKLQTTKTGRRLMRKAKKLDVTLGLKLKEQGEDSTLQVSRPVTLRR